MGASNIKIGFKSSWKAFEQVTGGFDKDTIFVLRIHGARGVPTAYTAGAICKVTIAGQTFATKPASYLPFSVPEASVSDVRKIQLVQALSSSGAVSNVEQ